MDDLPQYFKFVRRMLISSLKAIFRPIVFIAKNIIEDAVFNGQESADFIHNLCLTKFND